MPIAEQDFIRRLRSRVGHSTAPSLVKGVGDDCAVLRVPAGHDALITTDFSIEGVHFRRDWHRAQVVGRRCLTRGFSDIAAMGGSPIAAFLSLALPRHLPQPWADKFLEGLLELAEDFGVVLAGGDTAQSPSGIVADIAVLGSVPHGCAITRAGAHPGDSLYVTGALGGSAAAIAALMSNSAAKVRAADYPAHFRPTPRLAAGRRLRELELASAMIDISDGLSTDLAHICEESGVGAEIRSDAIPRATAGRPAGPISLDQALHGGDDYELLFSSPSSNRVPRRILGVPITRIGEITRKRELVVRNENGAATKLAPQGWEHFRR